MNDGATEDSGSENRPIESDSWRNLGDRARLSICRHPLLRPLKPALFDGCENFAVDVTTLAELGRGQTSQAHRVLAEIVFPLIEHASLMEKSDRVGVQALIRVFPYSFNGSEDQIGSQSEKTLHTDVAYLGRVAGDTVVDGADFYDWEMSTRTCLWLIGFMDADQAPFLYGNVPASRIAEGEDVRLELQEIIAVPHL